MPESKILQKINTTIQEITPVDNTLKAQAEKHLDSLSKPLGSLAALGGLEIATLSGLCLGAAKHKLVLVIDGFISSAAFMAAFKLCPLIAEYAFFSHFQRSRGTKFSWTPSGKSPYLTLACAWAKAPGRLCHFLFCARLAISSTTWQP